MRWLAVLGVLLIVACAGGTGPVSQGIDQATGCQRDADCPAGYYCVRGGCEALPQTCTTSADCQGGDVCQQGYCLVPGSVGSGGNANPGNTGSGSGAGNGGNGSGSSSGSSGSGGSSGSSGGSSGSGSGWGGLGSGSGSSAYYCQSCTTSVQCGGSGNFCLRDTGDSGTFCGVACNTNADCPVGSTCWAITDSQTGSTVGHACFPTSGSCQQPGGGSAGGSGTGGSGSGTGGSGSGTGGSGSGTGGSGSGTGGSGSGTGGSGSGTGGSGSSGGSSGACTPDTWSNFAGGFFDSYCSQCHSGEYDSNNYQNVAGNSSRISSYISSGRMPPGGGVSSSDKSRILKWLSCGAPQ